MRFESIKRLRDIVLNETGQMSIFIALIFQVLFVFFAMVINIGLMVHDKINLQNAVDLGAYYGAQRQAEILNEIAHINYQIRQDYKLLAWRYRVLGTLGRIGSENAQDQFRQPGSRSSGAGLSEKKWVNQSYPQPDVPAVCVNNDFWYEAIKDSRDGSENYCYLLYENPIPKMPDVNIIAPWVPGVADAAQINEEAQRQVARTCEGTGPTNWRMAMNMMFSYKLAVASRKMQIWELRKNLISSDFKDRNLESVREGVKQTILKNLTKANAESLVEGSFEFFNGLSHPACAGQNGEAVLPEILTAPLIVYVATRKLGNGSCEFYTQAHIYHQDIDQASLNIIDPGGTMRQWANEPEISHPAHSSLGFEKNPWCMSYVGVRAKTRPHKPFAPFGSPVTLEARAFAQPFGGRVGPWYRSRWPRGSLASSEGDRVDALTTPRVLPGGGMDITDNMQRLPNYSRFPGDELGLESEIALGAQHHIFSSYLNKPFTQRLRMNWYYGFQDSLESFDFLAGNAANGSHLNDQGPGPLRKAEMSAVAPDLFDATYYSVDPSYYTSYLEGRPDKYSEMPPLIGRKVKAGPDLGGRNEGELQKIDIEDQINVAFSGGFSSELVGKLFYPIRQWEHLLTAWAPNSSVDFKFPAERFGQCSQPANEQVMIPGKCAVGGRVGYSVRLISKSHLLFQGWKVGGDGEAEGAILNPPADEF